MNVLPGKLSFLIVMRLVLQLPFGGRCCAESEVPQPIGKLYEVGGHKMHLYATGLTANGPAVVLEAGAGAFSLDWNLVQRDVAQFARVCSYDRGGHA